MSKSAFIMDTPKRCGECPLFGLSACKEWSVKKAHTFPKGCTLRKLPKKKRDTCSEPEVHYADSRETTYAWGLDRGWNMYIEKFLLNRKNKAHVGKEEQKDRR